MKPTSGVASTQPNYYPQIRHPSQFIETKPKIWPQRPDRQEECTTTRGSGYNS